MKQGLFREPGFEFAHPGFTDYYTRKKSWKEVKEET